MKRLWPPLRRRLAIVRDVHQRGGTALFVQSFGVALVSPLLTRLPLRRLESLLAWATERGPRRADADASDIAATVLGMLQAGQPLVHRGCLTRGITLYCFLRRAGVDVSLDFGMGRPSADKPDGHCWLMRDGAPYLEPRDPRETYKTFYSFRGSVRT